MIGKYIIFLLFVADIFVFANTSSAKGGDMGEGDMMDSSMLNTAQAVVQKEVDMVRIDERVGEIIDADLTFYDLNGSAVSLKDYLGDKPLVLSFAYYSCETLCQFVLSGEVDVFTKMNEMGFNAGQDYQALTISFDTRDDKDLTKSMTATYGDKINRDSGNSDWTFLYGEEEQVRSVTEQLGYFYNFIPATGEFAHSTAIYVITPQGKISRYFYGIQYNPFDLKLALIEAKDEMSRSTVEKVLLFCYSYDSESRGYALVARNIMKAGGIITMIIMGGFFFVLNRKRRLS